MENLESTGLVLIFEPIGQAEQQKTPHINIKKKLQNKKNPKLFNW